MRLPFPAIPSWLLEPLWDATPLPGRSVYDPSHPLGCHKPRLDGRPGNDTGETVA